MGKWEKVAISRQQAAVSPVTDLSGENEHKTTLCKWGRKVGTSIGSPSLLSQLSLLKENRPVTKAVAGVMSPA